MLAAETAIGAGTTTQAQQVWEEKSCSANEGTEMVGMEKTGRQKISWEGRHSGGLARGAEVEIHRAVLVVLAMAMPQVGRGMW